MNLPIYGNEGFIKVVLMLVSMYMTSLSLVLVVFEMIKVKMQLNFIICNKGILKIVYYWYIKICIISRRRGG